MMIAHGGSGRMERTGLPRLAIGVLLAVVVAVSAGAEPHSVARRWNELMLEAIRNDFARPPIHARNLYHVSAAMWDAWAVYDDTAQPIFLNERIHADDIEAARHEAISYAAYRVLYRRYQISPGAYVSLPSFDDLLTELGYDYRVTEREGNSAAAVGNRIAKLILDQGYDDGADELGSYAFEFDYRSANPPLVVVNSGVGELADPQPLAAAVAAAVRGSGRTRAAGSRAALHRLPLGVGDFVRPARRRHGERRGRVPRSRPAALPRRRRQRRVPQRVRRGAALRRGSGPR